MHYQLLFDVYRLNSTLAKQNVGFLSKLSLSLCHWTGYGIALLPSNLRFHKCKLLYIHNGTVRDVSKSVGCVIISEPISYIDTIGSLLSGKMVLISSLGLVPLNIGSIAVWNFDGPSFLLGKSSNKSKPVKFQAYTTPLIFQKRGWQMPMPILLTQFCLD